MIDTESFEFLRQLKVNNDQFWFEESRGAYKRSVDNVAQFASVVLEKLTLHDVLSTSSGRKSMFRINRESRYSKPQAPYKTHFSGYFRRAGKFRRGGYYFHLEPGNTRITGGFGGPISTDLRLIRNDIAYDDTDIRSIISDPAFRSTFGEIKGAKLAKVPAGFEKDHAAGDLLRLKQFLLVRQFTDKEVLHADFAEQAIETYLRMRPFFDYMSEVLSSDVNGSF